MVNRILLAVICALLVLPSAGQSGPDNRSVPARPLDGIFDPEGWLEEPMRAAMVRKILDVREKQQRARVFVVVLPERPSDGRNLAARWGAQWAQGKLWGVLLHVPGESGFPVFEAGLARSPAWHDEQKREFQRSLDQALAKVRRGGTGLRGEREKVARGAADLAGELGYLSLIMRRIDRHHAQVRGDRTEGRDRPEEGGTGVSPIAIVFVVVGVLSLPMLFLVFRKSTDEEESSGGAFWFPDTIPRKRFRAPWSGGGNVLVDFRREKDEPER